MKRANHRSKALPFVAGSLVAAAAIAMACGSPEIVYVTVEAGGGITSDPPATTGADAGSDVEVDANDLIDASIFDAADRGDATKVADGAACPGANPCDCDNDGYLAKGACGGDDCDDRDALRHPNQTFVSEPPDPGKDGDWDCDGKVDRLFPKPISCATLLFLFCNATTQGFVKDVPCGEQADLHYCQGSLLACSAVKASTPPLRQACK